MYLTFQPQWRPELDDIKQAIDDWAKLHQVRYTTKFIKGVLRVGFDRESDFTLFAMTWNHDIDECPYMRYKIVTVQNERY